MKKEKVLIEWHNDWDYYSKLVKKIEEKNKHEMKKYQLQATHEAGHFFISKNFGGNPEFAINNGCCCVREVPTSDSTKRISPVDCVKVLLAGIYCEYRYYHKFSREDSIKLTLSAYMAYYAEEDSKLPETHDMTKAKQFSNLLAEEFDVYPETIIINSVFELDEIFYKNNRKYQEVLDEAREFYVK